MTDWDDVAKEIMRHLTKKERETLQDLIDQYGSIEEVVITAIRKMVNPDYLSVSDVELCMQKAMKISAYVNAVGGATSPASQPELIAREVAEQAMKEDTQQPSNPLAETFKNLANAISSAITAEVNAKISSLIPNMVKTQTGNDKKDNATNTNVFTGDSDEES